MDEYKDCLIIYKTGKGIVLRATKLTVQNADKFAVVYDGENIMAMVPFAEIKTIIFCQKIEADKMVEILTNG